MQFEHAIRIVSGTRLLILAVCFLTSIILIKAFVWKGSAQSNEPQNERTLKTKEFKDMPLVVKEVKNLQSDSWPQELEIKVKNVSNKPIYYIRAYLIFPDDPVPNGRSGIRLLFGNGKNGYLWNHANPEDPHIAPGETYTFIIGELFRKGLDAKHKRSPETMKKFVLEFHLISFGDGTGFEVGQPREFRGKTGPACERISFQGKMDQRLQLHPSTK